MYLTSVNVYKILIFKRFKTKKSRTKRNKLNKKKRLLTDLKKGKKCQNKSKSKAKSKKRQE